MSKPIPKEKKQGYAQNLNMSMATVVKFVGDLDDPTTKGKLNEYQRRKLALLGAISASISTIGMILVETADDSVIELIRK